MSTEVVCCHFNQQQAGEKQILLIDIISVHLVEEIKWIISLFSDLTGMDSHTAKPLIMYWPSCFSGEGGSKTHFVYFTLILIGFTGLVLSINFLYIPIVFEIYTLFVLSKCVWYKQIH